MLACLEIASLQLRRSLQTCASSKLCRNLRLQLSLAQGWCCSCCRLYCIFCRCSWSWSETSFLHFWSAIWAGDLVVLRPAVDAVIVNAFWAKHAAGTEERIFPAPHFLQVPSPSIEAERDYCREQHQERIWKWQQKARCNRNPKVYPNPDKLASQKPLRAVVQCLQSITRAWLILLWVEGSGNLFALRLLKMHLCVRISS